MAGREATWLAWGNIPEDECQPHGAPDLVMVDLFLHIEEEAPLVAVSSSLTVTVMQSLDGNRGLGLEGTIIVLGADVFP